MKPVTAVRLSYMDVLHLPCIIAQTRFLSYRIYIFRHICNVMKSDSFIISVCLCAHPSVSVFLSTWNNLATAGWIFVKFYIEDLLKICQENSGSTKIRQNMRHFRQGLGVFVVISRWSLSKIKFQVKGCREKIQNSCETHFSEKWAVYEIITKNMAEPDVP
jgi:hypothetical protein